ncbi:hypothetical protein Tco_0822338 [Tanacetum coccineum]|uniref:Tf2-1-like SH3-like domain-containing protein n=1 Tax=Tanacetum coccineum TaxID=301880 RepID=A0ABQ5AJ96_9ASTR
MLKVSPWKGVVHFGKWGKWNPKYVGPFKVLEKVRSVAYKLELPQELSRVHNTFYVSNLKKCYADEPLAVPLDGLHFDDKLQFVEEPIEIMDHEVKRLKRSCIPLVKVQWNSRREPEFTWERKDQFRKKYLHLFIKTAPSSTKILANASREKVKTYNKRRRSTDSSRDSTTGGLFSTAEEIQAREEQKRIDFEKALEIQKQLDQRKETDDIVWNTIVEQVQERQSGSMIRYQTLKKKPVTVAQARKNMMVYLKNMAGYKMGYFKGMSYDEIRPIFEKEYNKYPEAQQYPSDYALKDHLDNHGHQ